MIPRGAVELGRLVDAGLAAMAGGVGIVVAFAVAVRAFAAAEDRSRNGQELAALASRALGALAIGVVGLAVAVALILYARGR